MRAITLLAGFLLVAGTLLSPSLSLAEKRGVRVDGKAPAEYVAEQAGKSYAVVIGVDKYQKIGSLRYAVADAKAVAQTLKQRGYEVTELYNERATRRAIESELRTKLPDKVGEQDRVLIFYAGHGQDKKAKGGKAMGYLLPVDVDQEDIPATGVSMGTVKELADALPAKHVLFLLDVCFGGIAGTLTRGAPPAVTEAYLKQITRERGRHVITAGSADQEVIESAQWGHSVFTYFLLKGLNEGLADQDDNGVITSQELYTYLESRVFGEAQQQGHTQTPQMAELSGEKGQFVFFTSATGKPNAPTTSPQISGASTEAMAAMAKRLEEMERRLADQSKAAQPPKPVEVASLPSYSAPKETGREIEGKDGAKMLLIPAGEFMMGSTEGAAAEKPVHRVSLDAFYLDKYEVTNRLFQTFARATGYETTAEKEGKAYAVDSSGSWEEVSGANWRKPEGGETVFVSNREEHPVVSVSWYDAEAYCRWAGKRLPTEAEFEYANRGGTSTTYWWGDGNPGSRRVANIGDEAAKRQFSGWTVMAGYDDGYVRTAPVGSFEPNPFGLYDTTGNVWEWTADWYGDAYYQNSPSRNPTGAASGQYRVLRGGSWIFDPQSVRSAYRSVNTPSMRVVSFGFRCAKTP